MFRVAVFQPNGMLSFYDYKEFDTRVAAYTHMENIQRKYNAHLAVVRK